MSTEPMTDRTWPSDEAPRPTEIIQSTTLGKLAEALAKAQAELDHAKKGSENPHFRSKYADIAAVLDASRPLSKHGVAIIQIPIEREGRVALHTRLVHSSGEYIGGTFSVRPVKDDPQGAGSALTYLRRYGLQALAGIGADDDDGNAAEGNQASEDEKRPNKETVTVQPKNGKGKFITRDQQKALYEVAREELKGMAPEDIKTAYGIFLDANGYVSAEGEPVSALIPAAKFEEVSAALRDHCRNAMAKAEALGG